MDNKTGRTADRLQRYFSKRLKKVLKRRGEARADDIAAAFSARFNQCMQSADMGEGNYRFTSYANIFSGVCCYLVLQEYGYTKDDAYNMYGEMVYTLRMLARRLFDFADCLPNAYRLVKKSLLDDLAGPKARCWDTEILQNDEQVFTYRITKCLYVDTCAAYGCPELAKAFCEHDCYAFGNLHRRVRFVRYSTLGTGGDCCRDAFLKVAKTNKP